MALVKEMLAGYAKRVRIDNHLLLQEAQMTRLPEVQERIAVKLNAIDERINADPKLLKRFNSIKLTLPSD